jgi:uncharacterized protein (DUF983 family)
MKHRTFKVCGSSECGNFDSFPLSQFACSECGRHLNSQREVDERNSVTIWIMGNRFKVFFTLLLIPILIVLTLNLMKMLPVKFSLGILTLHIFAQISMTARLYPLFVKKNYEYKTDSKGHIFLACLFAPVIVSLTLVCINIINYTPT